MNPTTLKQPPIPDNVAKPMCVLCRTPIGFPDQVLKHLITHHKRTEADALSLLAGFGIHEGDPWPERWCAPGDIPFQQWHHETFNCRVTDRIFDMDQS